LNKNTGLIKFWSNASR